MIPNLKHKVKLTVLASKFPYRNKTEAERYAGKCKTHDGMIELHDITIDQLVDLIKKGHTILPAHVITTENEEKKLTFSGEGFQSTNIFFIDVDNSGKDGNKLPDHQYLPLSECESMLREKGLTPTFIYHSFSSKPDHEKYRVCWVTYEVITDRDQKITLHKKLMSLFHKGGVFPCDTRCIDLARIFYAGTIHSVPGNIISIQEIESLDIHPLLDKGTVSNQRGRAADIIHSNNRSQGSGYHLNTPEYWCLKQAEPLKLKGILLSKKTRTVNYEYDSIDILSLLSGGNSKQEKPLSDKDFVPFLPLHLFLGVELKQKFNCVFHDDSTPSANVFMTGEGKYRYHCFGCGKTLDIVGFLQELNGWSYREVYDFLGEVLGVKIESEWKLNKKKHLLNEGRYITGDLFKKHYPQVHNELKRSNIFPVLETLIDFALEHGVVMGNKLGIYLPLRRLEGIMRSKGHKSGIGRTQLSKKLKTLVFLGFLEVLSDKEIPEEFLRKSREHQKNQGYKYRTSFYAFPEWGHDLYRKATERNEKMKKSHFRKTHGISREKVIRSMGHYEADKIYVQDRGKGRCNRVERFYRQYEQEALAYLVTHGFIYKPFVLKEIKGYKKTKKLRLAEEVHPTLIHDHDLEEIRVNKMTRIQYRIPEEIPSNSVVLVKKKGE